MPPISVVERDSMALNFVDRDHYSVSGAESGSDNQLREIDTLFVTKRRGHSRKRADSDRSAEEKSQHKDLIRRSVVSPRRMSFAAIAQHNMNSVVNGDFSNIIDS